MSELSPDALGLIRNASGADDPNDSDRERIRLSLEQKLGAAAFATTVVAVGATKVLGSGTGIASVTGAQAASAAAVAKTGALSVMSKLLIAAGMVSAVSAAVMLTAANETATTSVKEGERASVRRAQPLTEAPKDEGAEPTPMVTPPPPKVMESPAHEAAAEPLQEVAEKPARTQRAATSRASSSLSEELSLLNQAQRALVGGNARAALAGAQAHIAKFPTGTLHEEARAVEALSRCALGEPNESVLATFEKHAPGSVLIARVRAGCQAK